MSSKLSLSLAALAVVATAAPASAAADPTRYLGLDQARVLGSGVMETTMGTAANQVDFRYGLMKDYELAVGYGFQSGMGLDKVAAGGLGLGLKYLVGDLAGLKVAGLVSVSVPSLSSPGTGLGYGASLPLGLALGGLNLDVQPYLDNGGMGAHVGVRQNLSTNLDILARATVGTAGLAVKSGLRYSLGGGGWLDLGLVDLDAKNNLTWGMVSLSFVGAR
ncbi:MAG: hypothetical protein VKO21_02880 [Candidatus Sericytochromatia bacterium]|nr:hypothetical protein [Candidatus Sericytochromatia bacterium]